MLFDAVVIILILSIYIYNLPKERKLGFIGFLGVLFLAMLAIRFFVRI